MIRLVVTAEEFGSTPAANRGILRSHRAGIVTSTSVAGDCADIGAAGAALSEHPELGVGLSLVLTTGRPVTSRGDVPSLLTPAGEFRARPAEFAVDWIKKAIVPSEVEHELDAQITRAQAAGIAVEYLCTRGHVGFLPGVGQIVERLARRHRIAGIRTAVEPPTLAWLADPKRAIETSVLGGLAWLMRRRLGALRHGPRTWGYLEAGRLDEVRILEIVGRMEPGPHELVCHPREAATPADEQRPREDARAIDERSELRALTSTKIKTAIERRGIVLCRWRDLF